MLSMVLCSRAGDGPSLLFNVNLRPAHAADFVTTLSGECKQPDDPPVVIIPTCGQNLYQLLVRKDSLP